VHDRTGKIVERDGARREYPFARHLGDAQCLACPRWDFSRARPRPPLDSYARGLLDLAALAFGHGLWPRPGGALDQDPELLDLLAAVWASPHRRALTDGGDTR